MKILDQWRICFRWQEDGVYDVEIVAAELLNLRRSDTAGDMGRVAFRDYRPRA